MTLLEPRSERRTGADPCRLILGQSSKLAGENSTR